MRYKNIKNLFVIDNEVVGILHRVPANVKGDGIKSIKELVEQHKSTLIFVNSRHHAEMLGLRFNMLDQSIAVHHGSLSKEIREETELILREGKSGIVVCTSSLELGLDIGSVELVIHYGSPRQVSKFIQRIGRSKHNRNESARGLIITNNPDDEFEAQAILDRIQEGSIEEQKIHDGSLDVLAHHLVGLSMQIGEISVEQAFDILEACTS